MPEMIVDIEEREHESNAAQQLREEADQSLMEYLGSLAADVPIKVAVIRKVPKTWAGRTIEGTLDTYEEPISEEQIREMYGGGTYALKIQRRDVRTGNWRHFTQRTIKIAGDPKLDSLITTDTGTNKGEEAPSVVNNAMRIAAELADKADARAERAEERAMRQVGPDPTILILKDELGDLRRSLAEKDARIFDMLNSRGKESSSSDVVLSKMLDGESTRMTALRAQVESEIRTINARHDAEIDRLHARYESQAQRAEDAHKRELDALNRSHDSQSTIMKISYESQMDGFKREIQHLASQLEVAQSELAVLRQLKNKSPVETITELATLKEAFENFSGGKEESGGTAERIISGIMGSPLVEGIGARLATGAVGAADATVPHRSQEPDLSQLEIDKPVKMPDGQIVVRRQDGQLYRIRQKPRPPAPTGAEGVKLDPSDVAAAVQFMEGACNNDVDPAQFATTARSLVPMSILASIRAQGVDHFLANVAKLDEGSILNSQKGRNWVRKVATILLG